LGRFVLCVTTPCGYDEAKKDKYFFHYAIKVTILIDV
jgi:hypothetical protein